MSTEFLAGFISGVAGLVVGSPLDVLKTRQQSTGQDVVSLSSLSWFSGLLVPIVSLGFMNAILFWSYNFFITSTGISTAVLPQLLQAFLAGMFSGLCVCIVSVPTEVIKVRAQISGRASSLVIRDLLKTHGGAAFFQGAIVTVTRDSIGYGFYFITFDGLELGLPRILSDPWHTLLAGGLAGCVSWFSIFPLDTIKTRVQAPQPEDDSSPLLTTGLEIEDKAYAMSTVAKSIYHESGFAGFFKGLSVTMLRAFLVNAIIFWADKAVNNLL